MSFSSFDYIIPVFFQVFSGRFLISRQRQVLKFHVEFDVKLQNSSTAAKITSSILQIEETFNNEHMQEYYISLSSHLKYYYNNNWATVMLSYRDE